MEPIHRDGKIREQVELEDRMRREYGIKWGMLAEKATNEFYNPGKINAEFRERFKKDTETFPYDYTGSGDSFFISKDMYNALVKICRCGRQKTEGHVLKCLQRVKAKYIEDVQVTEAEDRKDLKAQSTSNFLRRLPPTSAGVVGWPQHTYQQWESSTKYISPRYTMPGPRIQDQPYGSIFIG
ncbi:uncharacterized protein LOC129801751 isoform X2 [Phlebotomus papatasi]|uniref:uncharacterized protein LOC129801751 isoform X2 n=1 Tax=Phlebotomus papatasi TaxID=29031 RepID=UPI0024846F4D|nr:uncharacterized protein LOC129801751 isoform X2 [Phlebotomus papatasi]